MILGILYSRLRKEEKRLFEEARKKEIEVLPIIDEELVLDANGNTQSVELNNIDILLNRSIAHVREEISLKLFEARGIKTVNSYETAVTCNNKILTDIALARADVPTPPSRVAYSQQAALAAIEQLGYPVVLKPMLGSWGRLLAKVNDRDAAEALLEHKQTLGSIHHGIFYMQKYVDKPARDIRAFVVGEKVICAIYRYSEHWITNTARGGQAADCPSNPELKTICLQAARAVGGGILAIDILESNEGYLVCEVNHTMEFKNSEEPTGTNIARGIIDYCIRLAK